MKPITSPLRPGDQGPEVANLQEALALLLNRQVIQIDPGVRQELLSILATETQTQAYRDATAKSVGLFQEQHHLPVTGAVDGPTAEALNASLQALGAFDTARDSQKRVVAGQVGQEDHTPFKGMVILFHEGGQGSIRLGEDATDPEGRYTIGYDSALGLDGARLRVAAFDPNGKQRADATIAAPKPVEIVNLIVPREAPAYRVEGKVASRLRAGVGGLRVQIVDKHVGPDVQLAEVSTADDGSYRATFPYAGPKQQPDLQARVLAGEKFLGASDVRYNASNAETLHVVLPDGANVALASEHETLTGALRPHFSGNLRELQETDDRQDITYLANKTGWDARAVALAALSDRFSAGTTAADGAAIEPAFFYALFRAGLPANEEVLYQADPATVQKVWEGAAAQGVLPQSLAPAIPAAVQRFQRLSAQRLLTTPALAGASSLREMLTTSRLDAAQQSQFAALYAAHRTDLPGFWDAVTQAFGQETAQRLQVDGKLGFLTINNAPLMGALHTAAGGGGVTDPLQLAQGGYYRAAQWSGLLTEAVPIPKEIPGETPQAKRANYGDYLAAQVRLSYPTAAVAHMVKGGDLPLTGAAPGAPDQVYGFLTEHQGKFEIGMQPVQQYVARNQLNVAPETVTQIQRLQRVYQITPSDQAMTGLMKHGMDAAYHVVRYDRDTFVQTYQQELGGAESAAQTYDRSVQVHNAVLNVAVSYITAKNGITLGAQRLEAAQQGTDSSGQILQPAPKAPSAANAADVIAYPTLEGLFGSMDFCACDHCRSVLSPAAYLVDLLLFIDQQNPPAGTENPQTVLLDRRPDIQHLPLTCENTNTALPYIDVVNETLEYFIANTVQKLSLKDYRGHDTDGAASEDLLASPQFVMDAAYTTLRGERFPAPLPFHQPLENLRRYFDKFGVPLALAMERLRKGDDLERGANPYGWRDILMEETGLSREEYEILTDSGAVPLWRMYGFANGTADAAVIAALSNAKDYSRRVGITYDDLVAVLQTRFVSPNSDLIPKLERLGVAFATLKALKDGTITDAAFDALLPPGAAAPDPAGYGGDIKAWVRNDANFARIMGLITLTDPAGSPDSCDFGKLELRFARPVVNPNDTSTRLGAAEFVRLLRFVRLWKKMGWTIEQTDAAIGALYRADLSPLGADDVDTVAKLDAGFMTLLPRLGIVVRVMKALNLTPKRDLLPLLACWAEIGTHGTTALYRQMFLNPALLKQDAVFADNGFGEFLTDATKKLAGHAEALRSAFNLTGDEYDRIVAVLGYDANTPLTIPTITAIFRRGWLARKLKLSVRELLLLVQLTGLDPFAAPDPTHPAILRLIALVQALKARSLKTAAALYLVWNQDLSGKSAPNSAQITELARTLCGDFAAIDDQLTASEDPGGNIARARMALVYGQEAADAFFALLDDALALDVAYTHPASTLEAGITAADPKIAYDDFRHRLSRTGLLSAATRDALKNVPGVTAAFQNAVDGLFARGEDAKGSFFAQHPELKPLYDTYVASADPVDKKRNALLGALRPELAQRRMRQQALQRLSAAAGMDLAFTQALLDAPPPSPLHASGHTDQPGLNDVVALGTSGLAAQFFFRDTATGAVDRGVEAAPSLDYAPNSANALPPNPTPGSAISGIWSGLVEAPEAGFYNFVVEADGGATVRLQLGGLDRPLTQNGTIWRNTGPLELNAGTLYDIVLTVEKVKDTLKIKWETPKRAREVIPARYLYPATVIWAFADAYIRFLKAASLAAGLHLTANELAHFATAADYLIAGDGWLNALPVSGDPIPATAVALLQPLQALLDYAQIKAALAPGDESLLSVLQDPATATATTDSALYALTRWDRVSLNELLAHLGGNVAGLAHFDQFRRVYDAFALIQTMGIAASALIKATTNAPGGSIVRNFQGALHARYDAADWRDVVQPINDALRGHQRDALVAYILHQMHTNPVTAHIDTPDKLFEYFLMDVQMEPCMQTSRIRHALSSAQLFIERCLMNLEPRVSPAALNAKQWEWMKRYRVWEANRKVFLWPENWLEPELRDDKSPFFKEFESELLQSDITEDSAASVLLNYLSKLDDVAKLEPCGIYYVEADKSRRTGEIDHVIARTAGADRKYYYRRREYGYWTPWEQVKLDIEDNPVIPFVWKDRLLLFWLRILKESSPTPPKTPKPGTNLANADASQIIQSEAPKVGVRALLCCSEYYNGKWQATKTSNVDLPTLVDTGKLQDFKRADLRLGALVEGEALRLYMRDSMLTFVDEVSVNNTVHEKGFFVKEWPGSFLLYNTHSLPVRGDEAIMLAGLEIVPPSRKRAFVGDYGSRLTFEYTDLSNYPVRRDVLSPGLRFQLVIPRHELQNSWTAPFFLEDSRHVFYVTTTEQPVWISDYWKYGVLLDPGIKQAAAIPPLVLKVDPTVPVKPKPWRDGGLIGPDPGVIDPAPLQRFVTEDAYIRQGIGTTGSVMYGTKQIGPAGAISTDRATS
jgi:hypothetical protein